MVKISEAELEVMKIVWTRDEITSNEIIKELIDKNWTDNTVRTLINRLVEKKAIGIKRKEKKTYIYVLLIKEEKYKKYILKSLLEKLFNNSIDEMMKCLKENKKD